MYFNGLIQLLRKKGVGCHVVNLFLACILYADDLCLIAPSRSAMQYLLNICSEYCAKFCLTFNAKKSRTLVFGNVKDAHIAPLVLNSQEINIVSEWLYLGTTIVAGREFSFLHSRDLRSFYRSTNSVLSSLKKPNELVLMNLLYSMCVPILTYASEVKVFKYADMHSCNVALNDAIRRIFSYHRWESPRQLREQLNFPSLYDIFHTRSALFLEKCQKSSNEVIAYLTNKL